MRSTIYTPRLLAAVMLSSTSLVAPAFAADVAPQTAQSSSSDDGKQVEEIVVTAQKRSERLSDVPLSITAASAEQLAQEGVTSAADLEKIVPGFTYRQSQNGTPVFSIRGVGFYDEQLAVSPTVTVYTDQIPLPYGRMTEGASLDVERVEVLKGPQGTLFGQNATGGAINYVAAKPTSDFESGADIDYGRFNEVNVDGFLSGPVTDTINARLAVRSDTSDDWQQSRTRDATLGAKNFQAGRLLLDWTPRDDLKVELNINGWSDQSDTQAGQARGYLPVSPAPPETPVTIASQNYLLSYPYLTGNDSRIADWDPGRGFHRNDMLYQIGGRVDYDLLPWLHLVDLTSWSEYDANDPVDADATPATILFVGQTGHVRSLSEEFRLEGTTDPFKWVLGTNYEWDQTRETQFTTINGSNSQAPGPDGFIHFNGINLVNNENVQDVAAFGNLDYHLTETVTLQGGARFTSETRDFSGCLADGGGPLGFRIGLNPSVQPGGCLTFLANGQSGLYTTSLDQDNASWRGSINWKFTPDDLLYANVTKGFKSGSFGTLPAVFYTQFKPVSEESVVAYETGIKAKLLDRLLDVSGAAFYYDYSNKQIQGYITAPPFGNLPFLVNIPKSEVEGLEWDVTARPINGLRTSFGGTVLRTDVTQDALVGSPFGGIINAKGEPLPSTPRWQVQGDAQYDFPVAEDLSAFVGLNFSYRSGTVAAFGSNTGPAGSQGDFAIPGYGLLDLRAGLEIGDNYTVELYGHNVTNTQYWENVTHVYDTVDRFTGLPMTYGIRASARF